MSAGLLQDWLRRNADAFPDKPYVESIDQGKALSYGQLRRLANQISVYLHDRGIGANDRVALLANNSVEHLAAYIGVMAHGATICTINIEMNRMYFDVLLPALAPRLVLYEDGLDLDELHDTVAADWVALGDWQPDGGSGFFAEVAGLPDDAPVGEGAGRDDDACIYYTSGTSSKPKGAVLTFGELLDNAPPTADAFSMTDADRILDFRSFNWASPQILSALGPLSKGATLLLARKFSVSRYFDWVRDYRATIAVGNPTTINMLLANRPKVRGVDLPHLRFATSSSAPLMVEQWKRFEETFGITVAQGFGSSESGWVAGIDGENRRFGTVGKPFPYLRLTIVDREGTILPAGEIGYVEVGSRPDIAFRYLDEDGTVRVNSRGRMQTGDMGFLDEDGYLHLTGREKDLIIRGGVNISPLEIDNIVLELPGVAEAAAVGVPSPIYGEEVVLYLAAKQGAGLDADAVLAHCGKRLAPAKVPKEVVFRDALPKTDRGKMNRAALAEDWKREHAAERA